VVAGRALEEQIDNENCSLIPRCLVADGDARGGDNLLACSGRCTSDGSNKPNIAAKCQAAGDECMKTGTFLGPVSGKEWKNLKRQ
jgi:hypothetical protein